ncbi:protein UBASH3A homolog isoform X2 [Drosophila eugracilis]|uniref:protein UBASH3A homolog isoform X2 n=1 Tax=Drosophila eugracilis TaxID=29029 RepID=UPI0007E6056C|nr:protein UBASH3A homolog isoform X2 [Drosophila eugracilis]
MATLPPRKSQTPTRICISKQHLTPLQTLLQMGFPRHRAEKALASTGNRGVQIASDWLLAHVNDATLDECSPREYIIYACPTGPFLQQLEEFWAKSRQMCGWNGAHNYVPHITLVSFFKAPDECSLQLSKALKQVVDMTGALLDRPLKLEPYMSQNFMGFFVAEEDANYLKRLALQYVKEVSNSTISLEPHVKSLHLTLAYQFPQAQFNALKALVETLDAGCASNWELRLYSRDPRLATKQVQKVVYPHNPHETDELELRIGDYIYLNTEVVDSSSDGWAEGISWLTGSTGHLPVNYTERTAESDAWTLHRVVQLSKSVASSLTSAEDLDIVDGRSISTEPEERQHTAHPEIIEGSSFEESEQSVEKYLRQTLKPCLELPSVQLLNSHNLNHQHNPNTPTIEITTNMSSSSTSVSKQPVDEILVEPPAAQPPCPDDTLSVHSDHSLQPSTLDASHAKNRKIYIMRHGERVDFTFGTWIPYCFDEFGNYMRKDLNMPKTLPRRKNSPEGWQNDSPLTNVGVYQASLIGQALFEAQVQIDHVYCSPSYRCIQTCTSALEGLKLTSKHKIKLEPGLFEWMAWYPSGVPDWLTKNELIEANYDVDLDYEPVQPSSDLTVRLKESTEQFYERNHDVILQLLEQTTGNILVVAHATTLDTCSRQLTGGVPRSTNELRQVIHKIPYCSLATVEQVDGVWKLVEPECLPVTHSKNPRFEWNALSAT